MAADQPGERIAQFLEDQLFRPVRADDPDRHPPFKRADVEAARRRVAREREIVLGAPSASAMVLAFHEAAERSAATELEELLRTLGLPTFGAIRDELDKLAAELAVTAEPTPAGQIS